MRESWIPLECMECGDLWEQPPDDLPSRGSDFECDNCGTTGPVTEFIRTQEGLSILDEFHQ